MKLSEIIQEADKLPNDQKETILKIIDLKVEEQMKDFTHALEMFSLRFSEAEKNTQEKVLQLEKNIDRNMKILFWLLGIIGAGVVLGITVFLTWLAKL